MPTVPGPVQGHSRIDVDTDTDGAMGRAVVRNCAQAEAYVASVCFKHGPPTKLGVELEWTVHHVDDPARPLDPMTLRAALGEHAPTTFVPDSPHHPLPSGASITVEPGGQIEISSLPHDGLAQLIAVTETDIAYLNRLLADAGLYLGAEAMDLLRPARRLLGTPRYTAMAGAYRRIGPDGENMMCRTAGLQVCVDVGPIEEYRERWTAASMLGPTLIALFANSRQDCPDGTRWMSRRMRTLFGTDPARTRPASALPDPGAGWARRALHTSVLCVRRPGEDWSVPDGITFADWIRGALPRPPSSEDLDYHLTTFFPPVRPRGYLEIRYVDAQPGQEWMVPLTMLATVFADHDLVRAAIGITRDSAHRWVHAAKNGLADPVLAASARGVVDLVLPRLSTSDLPLRIADLVREVVERRLGEIG
jgi:glutamate--cysteine ligase